MIIFQKPNRESPLALAGLLFSFVTKGTLHYCSVAVFVIFGAIWGYQEITSGVNWFRKLLGIIAFLFPIFYLLLHFVFKVKLSL